LVSCEDNGRDGESTATGHTVAPPTYTTTTHLNIPQSHPAPCDRDTHPCLRRIPFCRAFSTPLSRQASFTIIALDAGFPPRLPFPSLSSAPRARHAHSLPPSLPACLPTKARWAPAPHARCMSLCRANSRAGERIGRERSRVLHTRTLSLSTCQNIHHMVTTRLRVQRDSGVSCVLSIPWVSEQ